MNYDVSHNAYLEEGIKENGKPSASEFPMLNNDKTGIKVFGKVEKSF